MFNYRPQTTYTSSGNALTTPQQVLDYQNMLANQQSQETARQPVLGAQPVKGNGGTFVLRDGADPSTQDGWDWKPDMVYSSPGGYNEITGIVEEPVTRTVSFGNPEYDNAMGLAQGAGVTNNAGYTFANGTGQATDLTPLNQAGVNVVDHGQPFWAQAAGAVAPFIPGIVGGLATGGLASGLGLAGGLATGAAGGAGGGLVSQTSQGGGNLGDYLTSMGTGAVVGGTLGAVGDYLNGAGNAGGPSVTDTNAFNTGDIYTGNNSLESIDVSGNPVSGVPSGTTNAINSTGQSISGIPTEIPNPDISYIDGNGQPIGMDGNPTTATIPNPDYTGTPSPDAISNQTGPPVSAVTDTVVPGGGTPTPTSTTDTNPGATGGMGDTDTLPTVGSGGAPAVGPGSPDLPSFMDSAGNIDWARILLPATLGVGATLYGQKLGADAIRDAANTQSESTKAQLALQNKIYEEQKARMEPWTTSAKNNLSRLNDATAAGGRLDPAARYNMDLYKAGPEYQNSLIAGNREADAIRAKSTIGGYGSGRMATALTDRAQENAQLGYQTGLGNWNNANTMDFNRLASMSDPNSVNQVNSYAQNYATGAGNTMQTGSNAQQALSIQGGRNDQGTVNSLAGVFGSGINDYYKQQQGNQGTDAYNTGYRFSY